MFEPLNTVTASSLANAIKKGDTKYIKTLCTKESNLSFKEIVIYDSYDSAKLIVLNTKKNVLETLSQYEFIRRLNFVYCSN